MVKITDYNKDSIKVTIPSKLFKVLEKSSFISEIESKSPKPFEDFYKGILLPKTRKNE